MKHEKIQDEWTLNKKGDGCIPTLLKIMFTGPRKKFGDGLQSDFTSLDEEELLDKSPDGYDPKAKRP
jgi:hypothetical protein